MAFGVVRASARSIGAARDADGAIRDLDGMRRSLGRRRFELEACGLPLAALYVEGAMDALLHAEAAIRHGVEDDEEDASWLAIGAARFRILPGRREPFFAVDGSRAPPGGGGGGVSIGSSLATSPAASSLLGDDDLAAGLMAAALTRDWIHLSTRTVFHGDLLAAHAVVATVAGRSSFPSWGATRFGGRVHEGSADVLGELGWRLLTGPPIPAGGAKAPRR